jgi:hypothetical protein
MDRRHGLFIALAIGLAAIAGTYAAFQTTDLGAQAATSSEREIAAADIRLDEQEAALQRAAGKKPPELPKLPARASGAASGGGGVSASGSGSAAPAAAAQAAALPAPSGPGPAVNSGPGSFDDHGSDDDAADAYADDLDERADAMEDAADEAEDAWEDAHDD